MKICLLNILVLLLTSNIYSQQIIILENSQTVKVNKSDFGLVVDGLVSDLVVDGNDSKTVHLAAKLFAEDIQRVTGQKAKIKQNLKSVSSSCVVIGTIENSNIIKELIKNKKIEVTEIKGEWESCIIQVVENPQRGVEKALVLVGSDRRGTAYGLLEISKQMGVSPWYYFADVAIKKKEIIYIKGGRFVQKSPSVKYRGIFINDEMWGLRPWAMNTLAPKEGKGIGPTTHQKIFELLLRLKVNTLWPAMHQQTKPFNYYEQNKVLADEYGIVMGSSHIEPMLRNNIAGAEWDHEYPDKPWDYVKNRDHIYKYWEKRIQENGKYENIYTIGKRGKDDEAGSEITVKMLEHIFDDQRNILSNWVNKNVEQVPQVLIPYTEVLGLYNNGLKVPDDVIICWPDDNFGNIRQLPNKKEQQRSGGSGVYYHFQWLNGATTAYPWLYTTPLALTWLEMKKAYDYDVRKLWIVNVGDIKPAEIGIEHFMQMAWDISAFEKNDPTAFLIEWATRDFGKKYASRIAEIMAKHYELGYARRPEQMVMFNSREKKHTYDWFSLTNYNDEAQKRVDEYDKLMKETDEIYDLLPVEMKDSFFQMVAYNVKCAGLHNKKVIYAQKSHTYGQQNRSSAAVYAAMAQQAVNQIHELINHYNRGLVTVGNKWDHMASLPGPWGNQWQQWAMPPLSYYSGNGVPEMKIAIEGGDKAGVPGFSVYHKEKHFIDLYNTGNGVIYWSSAISENWIKLSDSSGVFNDEKRIWITIDWDKAPNGRDQVESVTFKWASSSVDEWRDWDKLSASKREEYKAGTLGTKDPDNFFTINLSIFNPIEPTPESVIGFVESNGFISIEAEHYSQKVDKKHAAWTIIDGLGRTGSSITVLPTNISSHVTLDDIIRSSPVLLYDLYTFTEGEVLINFNCIPSNPINADYGLRLAVAIDDGKPIIVTPRSRKNVIDNLLLLKAKLNMPKEGQHKLKIWMVDPGLVIDKIIIDTSGLKDSYLGPPESVNHNVNNKFK